uniref:Retrotransposon protein, putative, Ty1-copia subclass n=1 Tax=Tanacetum cinerariifolium TaxID=118510 RepID=A0A6L2JZ08_TANCI|nr:retrotransposon protein, putative, Ty1-copia subclass [Tanacetum cinerariifolium]
MSGKMERKPYTHQVERAKYLLGLIHTDHKHEVFETFKVFQKEVENQLGKTIKLLRSDRGGEYISQEFLDHGIITHHTPPYTPQHNGVSERRNKTLLDMVQSMMSQTTLPKFFWDYALETAARILNMVPTKKVEKTPYEVWHEKAPKLSYLKVWGCEALVNLIDQDASGSLEDLEIIQEEDAHPSLDTSLNHEEDDLEIDESQRDLGEPANYKAALLDPESKKWLNTMNAEMQSMKENEHGWKYLGEAAYILGIKIYRDRSKRLIGMCQSAYSMENYKRGSIHMQEKLKLSKSQGASTLAEMKHMQNVSYASAVGSIMYAVRCTRPDVAFAQNITSRFQQNPDDLKRELRVSCYANAGYLTDADDLKSQTGYVFVLNGVAVDWKSATQSIFATSSAEAEYMTAFDASKEAVWVRKFISRLSVVP